MRKADHAAIALRLVEKIAETRAKSQNKAYVRGQVVAPDGNPRAYILDSLKHPAEARILQKLYGDAFILIGVVCSEPVRKKRLLNAFFTGIDQGKAANKQKVDEFMARDSDDRDNKFGQHVTDVFQEADFFVDNTAKVTAPNGEMKDAIDLRLLSELDRLVSIITHRSVLRPTIDETAMHVAHTAKLQSSCLSRQVGASLVDSLGSIVATGTNEVPRAGGGVYGDGAGGPNVENRCALCENAHCSNNEFQNKIIEDALVALYGSDLSEEDRSTKLERLRKTRLGGLLEFSRSVHAEMDALLSAARSGTSPVASRLFVTTFPCHYCARHIVSAGVYEVQYIEAYPKSEALSLHGDAIATVPEVWIPPSEVPLAVKVVEEHKARARLEAGVENNREEVAMPVPVIRVGEMDGKVGKVLFRPFVGIAPKLYGRVFLKDREYKNKVTGKLEMGEAEWGSPWSLHQLSYAALEASLTSDSAL